MWLEVRAYRVSEAAFDAVVAPRLSEPAVLEPRRTQAGELVAAPPPAPAREPITPAGFRPGAEVVDLDTTTRLYVVPSGDEASALVLDLDSLEGDDRTRRSVSRVELQPSKSCRARVDRVHEYIRDYEIEVKSASFEAKPASASLNERLEWACRVARLDDGTLDLEFELADEAVVRPVAAHLVDVGYRPLRIETPRLERVGVGARVSVQDRDALICTWESPKGERAVVLLEVQAGALGTAQVK